MICRHNFCKSQIWGSFLIFPANRAYLVASTTPRSAQVCRRGRRGLCEGHCGRIVTVPCPGVRPWLSRSTDGAHWCSTALARCPYRGPTSAGGSPRVPEQAPAGLLPGRTRWAPVTAWRRSGRRAGCGRTEACARGNWRGCVGSGTARTSGMSRSWPRRTVGPGRSWPGSVRARATWWTHLAEHRHGEAPPVYAWVRAGTPDRVTADLLELLAEVCPGEQAG